MTKDLVIAVYKVCNYAGDEHLELVAVYTVQTQVDEKYCNNKYIWKVSVFLQY